MMRHISPPTRIMLVFLVVLLTLALKAGIDPARLAGDALRKLGMSAVLVLSLVPMMRAGMGLNFGMPIGVSAGLLGMCLSMNARLTGVAGFAAAIGGAVAVGSLFGYVYGRILNVAKGREEVAGVFLGYAFLPLMSVFWTLAPFSNRKMLYPVGGQGLRPRIGLDPFFAGVLDKGFDLTVGGVAVPLGLLLFAGVLLALVALFYATATGKTFSVVGENERYARILGISVEGRRIASAILSTVLAAVGICVYAQSYGFAELYESASVMTFPAVCALLVGGASRWRAGAANALLGVAIYQTMYLLSTPVANAYLASETTELFRMVVTNGVILYAFLRR